MLKKIFYKPWFSAFYLFLFIFKIKCLILLSECLSCGIVISVSLLMADIGKTVVEGVVNEVSFLNNAKQKS